MTAEGGEGSRLGQNGWFSPKGPNQPHAPTHTQVPSFPKPLAYGLVNDVLPTHEATVAATR